METFKASFNGDIVLPSSPDYQASLTRWAVNNERNASVILFPKDSSAVGEALAFSKSNGYPVAVKGGGHNFAGSSSIEDGLVIDLSRHINHVRVDKDKKLGYVGGGAIWEQVDKEAIKYGLAAVGGTVNNTGVGGFTVGGGYGFLTSSYGLAIDNLVQATVVTASGAILTASSSSNQDLFWALRGGGYNCGIVTEFVFKLHEQRPSVYFGMLIYDAGKKDQLVEATRSWWRKAGERESMMHIAGIGPGGKPAIILIPFYNGSEEEGRRNFKDFLDIGPLLDKTAETPYEQVNDLLNFVAKQGAGVYTKGVATTSPSLETFSSVLARAIEISQSPPEVYGGIQAKLMFDYHPNGKVLEVGENETAFRRDSLGTKYGDARVVSVILHLSWPGATDKELVKVAAADGEKAETKTEVARRLAKELGDIFTSGKMDTNASYANYDGDANYTTGNESIFDRTKLKFGDNYARLQRVKKEYDPENVFNRWFPVQPA